MRTGVDRKTIAELHKHVIDTEYLKRILESRNWLKAYRVYYGKNARC
jgi:predicted regulator of amino acid metabolism with ACT domain